jgi:hypothetical protein
MIFENSTQIQDGRQNAFIVKNFYLIFYKFFKVYLRFGQLLSVNC